MSNVLATKSIFFTRLHRCFLQIDCAPLHVNLRSRHNACDVRQQSVVVGRVPPCNLFRFSFAPEGHAHGRRRNPCFARTSPVVRSRNRDQIISSGVVNHRLCGAGTTRTFESPGADRFQAHFTNTCSAELYYSYILKYGDNYQTFILRRTRLLNNCVQNAETTGSLGGTGPSGVVCVAYRLRGSYCTVGAPSKGKMHENV